MKTKFSAPPAGPLAALGAIALLGAIAPVAAASPGAPAGYSVSTFATAPAGSPAVSGPDDVAGLGHDVFVGWQNGVGTKGEPGPGGANTSTVVEYGPGGAQLQSWSLVGKVDGMGGDPRHDRIVLTANEDGNSSLYTIRPAARPANQVHHFTYAPAPDAAATGGLFTGGGTDAVVVHNGHILLSASNPSSLSATAVVNVRLHPETGVATLTPTFADNASATDAVSGQSVKLALTDPDSNAGVPETSPRFGGEFVLDSQGDQQLIFARGIASGQPRLTRLSLTHGGMSAGVDDVRWARRAGGTLIVVDGGANTVYAVTGPFSAGQAFGSLDTVGSAAMNTEVDTIDLSSGALTPFLTGLTKAKGLLWMPGGHHNRGRS